MVTAPVSACSKTIRLKENIMRLLYKTAIPTVMAVLMMSMSGAACAEDPKSHSALIDQALKAAMIPETLDALSRQMQADMAQNPRAASMTPEQRAQMSKLLESAFDVKAQYADVAQVLADQFNARDLHAFIKAYSSPVAKKLNAMMIDAYNNDYKTNLQKYSQGLDKNPPDKQRVKMIARLDDLTGASKNNADAGLQMMGRLAGITSDDPRYEKLKAKILSSSREQSILTYLFTLQNASDEEVSDFAALHDDPAVARATALIGHALVESLQGSFTRMMETVASMPSQDKPVLGK